MMIICDPWKTREREKAPKSHCFICQEKFIGKEPFVVSCKNNWFKTINRLCAVCWEDIDLLILGKKEAYKKLKGEENENTNPKTN